MDVLLITIVHIFVELIVRKPFQHFILMLYYTHLALLYLFKCPNSFIFHKKSWNSCDCSGIWCAITYSTPVSDFSMLVARYANINSRFFLFRQLNRRSLWCYPSHSWMAPPRHCWQTQLLQQENCANCWQRRLASKTSLDSRCILHFLIRYGKCLLFMWDIESQMLYRAQ